MNPKLMMKFLLITLLIGVSACNPFGGEETPEPTPIEPIQQPNVVSAEAFVVPLHEATLSFDIGGQVTNLPIEAGDTVAAGDLIAELDNTTQQAELAQAQAQLAEAQARLADAKAGATQEQIAQAEAAVARAEAALAERVAGATEEAIAQAEARVETARAQLAQVLAGPRDEDIEAAAARLLDAEAEVRIKQAEYDENVFGEPARAEPYGIALQRATLAYEQAQAEYNKLLNSPTAEEIAVSRAQLQEAEAALAQTRAGATPEQIAQAQAEVQSAQASLADVQAGATEEQIAINEAGVKTAEANVGLAEAALGKTQLTAPFNGIIGLMEVDQGETIQPGTPIAALGDNSQWQIETDDLTEIDVVNVQPGAKVNISVDALPQESYTGEVVRITPKSERKAGDETYTVLINITEGDTSKLRWGMTTFVDIEVGPEL